MIFPIMNCERDLWSTFSRGKTKLDGKEDFIQHELYYGVSKSAIARKLHVSRGALVNFIETRELEPEDQ